MRRASAHRVATAAAAALSLLASGCTALPGGPRPEPEPVLIGVDLDLSAPPGIGFGNALRLQLEQLDEEHAAAGRRLRLRVLDNHGQAATSAANLAALTTDPQVAAVITAGCPQCLIDIAADLAVPVVSLDAVEAVAAPAGQRRWVFRIGPVAADNADAMSQAIAAAGADTLGVIATNDPYGDDGMAWLADAADRDGLAVVTRHQVNAGDSDAIAAAAEAVAGWTPPPELADDPFPPPVDEVGPDAVVLWLPAPEAGRAAAALREAGYDGPLYLDMLAADELFPAGHAAAWDGAQLVFTATAVADQRIAASPALAARQAWLRAYTARYGTYHLHSTFAADALLVLARAVDRAGGDPAAIRRQLESTRVDGLTGQIRFSAGQHTGLSPNSLVLLTAAGDRWR